MFISVAVPVPTLDLLTYLVPDGVGAPSIGARVVVPLGSRAVTGIIVACDVTLPAGVMEHSLKPVSRIMDEERGGCRDWRPWARHTGIADAASRYAQFSFAPP